MATNPKPGLVKPPARAAASLAAVPPAVTKGEEGFIAGAPDAPKATRRKRGRKEQISLTLKPELIDQVDAKAEAIEQSRASWISAAITRSLRCYDGQDGLERLKARMRTVCAERKAGGVPFDQDFFRGWLTGLHGVDAIGADISGEAHAFVNARGYEREA